MKEAKKYVHWKAVRNMMVSSVCEKIEAHNRQYPALASEFRRLKKEGKEPLVKYWKNFAGRVKGSEKTTLLYVIQLFAMQVADDINEGIQPTNRLSTNRVEVRHELGTERVINRHLGKGVLAGILLGRDFQEGDAKKEYLFHEGETARIGAVPYKCNHGRCRDFEILISPDILPVELLANLGTDPMIFADFDTAPTPLSDSMRRKTPVFPSLMTSNEDMRTKVSPIVDGLTEDDPREDDPKNVGQNPAAVQT